MEATHSRTKSTLSFYLVCVKSLRMNRLSVSCCRPPVLAGVPDPPWERGQQNQSLSWRSPGAVGGPPPPPAAHHYEDIAKQVLAAAQCPSALFEYLPHLSLNILGWFLCRKSSVSYRESVRGHLAACSPAPGEEICEMTPLHTLHAAAGVPTHVQCLIHVK